MYVFQAQYTIIQLTGSKFLWMVDNSPSSWVIFFILDQSYSLLIFFKYEIQMALAF